MIKMAKRKRAKSKSSGASVGNFEKRIRLVIANLFFFLILFLVSFALYRIFPDSILNNLFGLLSIIFGFLTFAFVIVWAVFKITKRK